MPDLQPSVTYAEVSGDRVASERLQELRTAVLALAREHGMPTAEPPSQLSTYEGLLANLLHQSLPMSPHEAAHEEVWSYLTCCWLLDVAIWRFGPDAPDDRFVGHLNRNAFRRLWWRAEILDGWGPGNHD